MRFYKYFLDGTPLYLAKHYWWAYLWGPATWFFDHQPIINAILFGQYKKLMNTTMNTLQQRPSGRTLQLTCVYGCLTPTLCDTIEPDKLHITDVAMVQLKLAQGKIKQNNQLLATRMNAEQLGYADNSFDTIILFFLLHEMPHDARLNTLKECMRILKPGGRLLMTEYGELPKNHLLYRFPLFRIVLVTLEPFLGTFWKDNVLEILSSSGKEYNKKVNITSHSPIFNNFYRVSEFTVKAND